MAEFLEYLALGVVGLIIAPYILAAIFAAWTA